MFDLAEFSCANRGIKSGFRDRRVFETSDFTARIPFADILDCLVESFFWLRPENSRLFAPFVGKKRFGGWAGEPIAAVAAGDDGDLTCKKAFHENPPRDMHQGRSLKQWALNWPARGDVDT